MRDMASILRVIEMAALAVAIWALAKYGQPMPAVQPADAPAAQFSAMRADATLARILGLERPHPASSPQNAAVRARIQAEFEKLGMHAVPHTAMGCNVQKRFAMVACASVTDLVAPVLPGEGKAILLLAHYDSVPAGPGAADDASGVASVIETARALRAGFHGEALHPVIAVLTDGEEYGLLGAAAFLDDPALKERVGVVVNVEARGNRGPSRLFQTSDGNAKLIDLYARAAPGYASSSLYGVIYKYLPNDTDLTLFLRDGFPGFNFAFIGNVAAYHTPLDTRRNLSLATLQDQGDNLLGVARGLEQTSYSDLTGGPNAVYVDVLGRWLPRLHESWALPVALVLLVALIGAVVLSGPPLWWGEWARAAAIFPALVIGAGLAGWAMVLIAQLVSGMPDPAYAHPAVLRGALALTVAAMTLAVSRFCDARAAAGAVWLWIAALGALAAAFLPGASPYFLLPLAVAAVAMLATARLDWASAAGQGGLLIAAAAALVLWLQLAVSGEAVMGLRLFALFVLPASIAAATLVPLLAGRPLPQRLRIYSVGGCFAGAAVLSVVAGLQPAYSETAPQRLNLNYVADQASGRAQWAAETRAPLPAALRKAARFSDAQARPYPASWQDAYLAPAPHLPIALPSAALLGNGRVGQLRRVTLGLEGSSDAAMMSLIVPGAAKLKTIVLGQKTIAVPAAWAQHKQVLIACLSADCAAMPVTLDMADTGRLKLGIVERRAGLPAAGAALAAARGRTAVPSQIGDGVVLVAARDVPAAQ